MKMSRKLLLLASNLAFVLVFRAPLNVVNYFWKKWTRDYFSSLLIQPKWHTAQRNLREGDVVLIQDNNQIRGKWKLGVVLKTFPGEDGRVRRVQVQ